MARRRRQRRAADDEYRYFHLTHLDTAEYGKQIEQFLIENRILAEKSVTISGCWSFRWKKADFDEKQLNLQYQVSFDPGIACLQKRWAPVGSTQVNKPKNKENGENNEKTEQITKNTQKGPRKRRRPANKAN